MDKIQNLKELINLANKPYFSVEEGVKLFASLIKFVKDLKQENNTKYSDLTSQIEKLIAGYNAVANDAEYATIYFKKEIGTLKNVIAELKNVKPPVMPKMQVIDEEKLATRASKMAQEALKPLIPVIPTTDEIVAKIPIVGEKVRDALELLKNEERLDASAIKNLPENVTKIINNGAGGTVGGIKELVAGSGISIDNSNLQYPIISAPGSTTDEKVKLSASDPTAGYLDAKLVESNKVLLLDQTTPQTVTGLDDGILSLNSGELGTFHYENKWFVSSETGSDDNDGKSEGSAFELLRKGLEQCSSGDVVAVTDSATYTPDSVLSIPNGVTLYMPLASLSGEIQLGTSSRFIAKGHYPSDDGQTMVSCIGTSGSAYTVYGMNSNGYSDIIHFKPTSVGGYIVADARHITVGTSTVGHENILVYSTAGSTGVNIATTGANFSCDKALNYGYVTNLVYGTSSYAQWNLITVGTPVTITYDNTDAVTVSSYKMKATSSGTRMPRDWTFYGQLAGGGWEELDNQEDIEWTAYEEKEFTISSPDSYDEYKIVIASTTNGDWLQIDDFGLLAGVASVGGDVMIESDILTLGEYAQGIQSHDSNQRVVSNINNVYSTGSNDVFVDMSNGTVSHRGNIVTVETVWNKTGGILTWNTSFDQGTKTGDADSYTLKNTEGLKLDQTTPQTMTGTPTFPVLRTPKIYPSADSTTAVGIFKADGTTNVLNVDTTNGRVGIGTTAPGALLNVNGVGLFGATTIPSSASANSRLVVARDGGNTGIDVVGSASGFPFMEFNRSRGTVTSPTTVVDGDQLGAFLAGGYSGASTNWTTGIEWFVDGTVSTNVVPTRMTFSTGTGGSRVERMRITSAGNVGIGTTTPGSKLTVSGHIGSLGTIPTLTSAGTGASIATGSTDTAGEITQGTTATGAVITFATAYTNIPFAVVTSQAGLAFSYTVSTTAITITNIGALSETKLNYHVIARE